MFRIPNREIGILSYGDYNSTPELHSLSSSKYAQTFGDVASFVTRGSEGPEVLHGRRMRFVYQCQREKKHRIRIRPG